MGMYAYTFGHNHMCNRSLLITFTNSRTLVYITLYAYSMYVAQTPKHVVTPYKSPGLTGSLVLTYTSAG